VVLSTRILDPSANSGVRCPRELYLRRAPRVTGKARMTGGSQQDYNRDLRVNIQRWLDDSENNEWVRAGLRNLGQLWSSYRTPTV